MLYFAISLIGLIGVSLLTFVSPFRTPQRAVYARPPVDWPDVSVDALALFQKTGRINQPLPGRAAPTRVASFDAAQDVVLALVRPSIQHRPEIALRLSPKEEDWIDVLLNDTVVVQVPTAELTLRKGRIAGPR